MADQRTRSGHSSPSPIQLPSFSSLSGSVSRQGESHDRLSPIHDFPYNDMVHALRQQIQARDQTISMLRAELDRLQPLQPLYEALEDKSKIQEYELATLFEERSNIRNEANALANEVEKLTRDKEELQTQSQANAAQWRQIVSMSSRLQVQGVEETRRFSADREAWARERERLEQRIIDAQEGMLEQIERASSGQVCHELRRSLTFPSMSDDQVRQELVTVREKYQELEELLSAVVKESAHIERTSTLLKEVKERLGARER